MLSPALLPEVDLLVEHGLQNRIEGADVVHRLKSFTAALYIHGVREEGWPPFEGRLWQRNYWERVIRNDRELAAMQEYIANNPAQ